MDGRMKCWLLGCVLIVFFPVGTLSAEQTEAGPILTVNDCLKCHVEVVRDVKTNGARHLTKVTCLDCHHEHPPAGTEVIPECSRCHNPQENRHFAVGKCAGCHDPHHPLKMDFSAAGNELIPVCLSCHQEPGVELAKYPSRHSQMSCAECHPQHGTFQECSTCHEAHGGVEMSYQDCRRCHKPHMPTLVKYDSSIPISFCAACHRKETGMLAENRTKHHALSCVYCHKNQHKVVPECEVCHGRPHGEGIHKKFASCLKCHVDAHALGKD